MDQNASTHGIIEEVLECLVIFRAHLGQRLLWVFISVQDSPINLCCLMKGFLEGLSSISVPQLTEELSMILINTLAYSVLLMQTLLEVG
eukprot:828240-Ditylum_brightwellii.AAC.1